MTSWDGKEHRASNITLHDILLELREFKAEHKVDNTELKGELKLFNERLDHHAKEDAGTFKTLYELINKATGAVTWLSRVVTLAIGGGLVIQFLIQTGIIPLNRSPTPPADYRVDPLYNNSEYVGKDRGVTRKSGLD